MPIELKMPALSPTMEEGTLAKWLVKVGDRVTSGDILAEIETDKATMEFEAIDEGVIAEIRVVEGSDGVKVGTVIALITGEGEASAAPTAPAAPAPAPALSAVPAPIAKDKGDGASPVDDAPVVRAEQAAKEATPADPASSLSPAPAIEDRFLISPLAKRLAAAQGIDLATVTGTGPNGRIVKADIEAAVQGGPRKAQPERVESAPTNAASPEPVEGRAKQDEASASKPAPAPFATDIPHEVVKLSNIRKTIARRLTESKQTVPHIYLTVDVRLDALLKLRGELNAALEPRGVKLSVNDMLVKALALALVEVPACNVSYTPTDLIKYSRADISVAVSTPTGLITPIVVGADSRSMSSISTAMKDLAERAKAGKLALHEFQGGTASISNMGMMGIKQFDAVINPPQGMILAVGAGEQRPYIVDGALAIATVMSATGSFDHRAIDGADGAQLMGAFKRLVEAPLGLVG